MIERADVPCGSCRACCGADAIVLFEGEDNIASFDHVVIEMPGPSGGIEKLAMVKKGADGNCIYLTADGCAVHDRAPSICRAFDCRRFFLSRSRNERRAMLKNGMASSEVIRAGRERVGTL